MIVSGATTHATGVRNGRRASGSRRRRTRTHTATATNAHNVPALASEAITSIGVTAAMVATTTAVAEVMRAGGPRLRQIVARLFGKNPSRAITRKIRLWP